MEMESDRLAPIARQFIDRPLHALHQAASRDHALRRCFERRERFDVLGDQWFFRTCFHLPNGIEGDARDHPVQICLEVADLFLTLDDPPEPDDRGLLELMAIEAE